MILCFSVTWENTHTEKMGMVMTAPVLNLSDVNFDKRSEGHDEIASKFFTLCTESISHWRDAIGGGLLKRDARSFAVVVKVVLDKDTDLTTLIDDPEALFDFAYLLGGESRRYAANALRKMRAVARTGLSTAELSNHGHGAFENVVDGTTDTHDNLPWGEFPYGGALLVGRGDVRVLVGVSGFTQEEDDWLASMVGGFCALKLTEHNEAAPVESSRE